MASILGIVRLENLAAPRTPVAVASAACTYWPFTVALHRCCQPTTVDDEEFTVPWDGEDVSGSRWLVNFPTFSFFARQLSQATVTRFRLRTGPADSPEASDIFSLEQSEQHVRRRSGMSFGSVLIRGSWFADQMVGSSGLPESSEMVVCSGYVIQYRPANAVVTA
jgi:hypothetical protein